MLLLFKIKSKLNSVCYTIYLLLKYIINVFIIIIYFFIKIKTVQLTIKCKIIIIIFLNASYKS